MYDISSFADNCGGHDSDWIETSLSKLNLSLGQVVLKKSFLTSARRLEWGQECRGAHNGLKGSDAESWLLMFPSILVWFAASNSKHFQLQPDCLACRSDLHGGVMGISVLFYSVFGYHELVKYSSPRHWDFQEAISRSPVHRQSCWRGLWDMFLNLWSIYWWQCPLLLLIRIVMRTSIGNSNRD